MAQLPLSSPSSPTQSGDNSHIEEGEKGVDCTHTRMHAYSALYLGGWPEGEKGSVCGNNGEMDLFCISDPHSPFFCSCKLMTNISVRSFPSLLQSSASFPSLLSLRLPGSLRSWKNIPPLSGYLPSTPPEAALTSSLLSLPFSSSPSPPPLTLLSLQFSLPLFPLSLPPSSTPVILEI